MRQCDMKWICPCNNTNNLCKFKNIRKNWVFLLTQNFLDMDNSAPYNIVSSTLEKFLKVKVRGVTQD